MVSSTSLDAHDPVVAVVLDVVHEAVHVATAVVAAQRERDAERTEARVEPAVPRDRLPDARAPRVVAEADRVGELELLVADGDGAGDRHVLLGVAAREPVLRTGRRHLAVVPLGFAAERLRGGDEVEVDGARLVRVARERRLRLGHLARVREHAHLAVVGDVVLLVRRHHVEPQPRRVVRVVTVDGGPAEHEADAPVGQIEAHRHLGVPLVGAVAHADPAAHSRLGHARLGARSCSSDSR